LSARDRQNPSFVVWGGEGVHPFAGRTNRVSRRCGCVVSVAAPGSAALLPPSPARSGPCVDQVLGVHVSSGLVDQGEVTGVRHGKSVKGNAGGRTSGVPFAMAAFAAFRS